MTDRTRRDHSSDDDAAAPERIDWADSVPVQVAWLRLDLPAALVRQTGVAIDGPAAVFEGPGITVVVDLSPFADRLEAHVGKPGYQEESVGVADARGRRVAFRDPQAGTSTVALHVGSPRPFTVVVTAVESVPDAVPREVLASVGLA